MDRKKKDNPIAMAVMGVILAAALLSVWRSLFGGPPAPGVHVSAATAQEPASEARGEPQDLPVSDRDPFSSARLKAPKNVAQAVDAHAGRKAGTESLVLQPVKQIRVPVSPADKRQPPLAATASTAMSEPGPSPYAKLGMNDPRIDELQLIKSLRVTAIVVGPSSYAVLEPAGQAPRTVHIDSGYKTLQVVTIRASEIVLKGQSGLWTIPLSTPESDSNSGRKEISKG